MNKMEHARFAGLARQLAGLSLFALLFLLAPRTAIATPPSIVWEQIETDHFVVIYDSRHKELGALYARSAELAWTSASPTFGLWPRKTAILIDDSTDIANGSATGTPYPIINAYPVLPSSLDSVSDYGNWGLELITHEYTHILNFEPATGVMRPLRWIFGSVVRPNMLLPRWYSEGLAVEMETRLSTFGRLRSANYLSVVRAMSEEGTLSREDISRVNEVSIPDWPGGIRPYLMGAMIWDTLVREKGEGIIGELNLANSRRLPYFINTPVEERLGLNYQQLLRQTYERAEKIVEKQIALIRAADQPKEEALPNDIGYFSHSFVYSPDGERAAWVVKTHNSESVRTVKRGSRAETEVTRTQEFAPPTESEAGLINRVAWFPDSKTLVYDSVDLYDRYYEYSDLYSIDTETNKSARLTRGLRAREPSVSTDGKHIVFVQNTPGSTRLVAVRADGSEPTVLYTPAIQTRVSRPEFLTPSEIIFSEKRDDGAEIFKIVTVRVESGNLVAQPGELRSVLTDFKPVHFPRMTKFGLLFVSDRSGVANLYLASRDLKSARPVTNTTTRILTGDLDPRTNDLVYSRLESDGSHLYTSPRESWTAWAKKHGNAPQVGPLIDAAWPEYKIPTVETKIEPEPYSPWGFLIPRYWVPSGYVGAGVAYVSASTGAADPTGRHSYSLQGAYDSLSNASSVIGSYTNMTTPVAITLSGLSASEYVYSGNFNRHTVNGTLTGGFFIPKLNDHFKGSAGWIYSAQEAGGASLKKTGPTASFTYRNVQQRGLEISPERGGALSLGYQRYLPSISDQEYETVTVAGSKYFSGWLLPERHVFALFLNASVAPRLSSSLFGTSVAGGDYQTLPGLRGLVMRGYNNGVFLGRNLVQATAEYRFPLWYSYRGYRTLPFFFQRWHASVFADALTLDGGVYDSIDKVYKAEKLGRPFYGTGAELKLDATVGYHLPIQFILGLYYGVDTRANPYGLFPSFSLVM